MKSGESPAVQLSGSFDHGSDPNFLSYYASESLTATTHARFSNIKAKVLALAAEPRGESKVLEVLDIGCGAGTQCRLWAADGHRVSGLDVNGPLIELARRRAHEAGLSIEFTVGSATALPYAEASKDVCLMPELLEHVQDWQACVDSAIRVLRPNGILFLSTTNALCPKQQEFNLPAYSWYPAAIKRHIERLSVTTRPSLANYAKYPAVHWFTPYGLRSYLAARGMQSFDRFDMIDDTTLGTMARAFVGATRRVSLLRWLGHVATEGTVLFAIKRMSCA